MTKFEDIGVDLNKVKLKLPWDGQIYFFMEKNFVIFAFSLLTFRLPTIHADYIFELCAEL